jgi:hypothetical protein
LIYDANVSNTALSSPHHINKIFILDFALEKPGHFGDVWKYWTDDGLGYYEFLQVSASFQILISRILMFAFS